MFPYTEKTTNLNPILTITNYNTKYTKHAKIHFPPPKSIFSKMLETFQTFHSFILLYIYIYISYFQKQIFYIICIICMFCIYIYIVHYVFIKKYIHTYMRAGVSGAMCMRVCVRARSAHARACRRGYIVGPVRACW